MSERNQSMVRPHIVFCFTDQQKASSLDLYNDTFTAVAARNLRRLAERGTVFERAYCAAPLCVPSRIALMTGQYPTSSGYIANGPMLDLHADTLPNCLKAAGYATYLSGKDHCFARGKASAREELPELTSRYDKHFLAIHNDYQPPEICEAIPKFMPFIERSEICHTMWGAEITPWTREETLTKVLTDQALTFLDEHLAEKPGQPFFLHWGPPDPHEYYQVPQEYADRFPPDQITLPPNWAADLSDKAEYIQFMRWFFSAGEQPPTEADARRLISVYLGMCAQVDDELGRLIDYIESRGLMDETIFVFSSDHGDMCGELGLVHKWNGLYDGVVRVPLVISAPGAEMKRNQRVSDPVSLVDLAATLCELAGACPPKNNQGRSLVDLLEGRGTRDYVFLESGIAGSAMTMADTKSFPDHRWDAAAWGACPYDPPHRFTGKCYGVRDRRYKLIFREGQRTELYDLTEDPGEVVNRIDDASLSAEITRLQSALIGHLLRVSPNIRGCSGYADLDARYLPGSGTVIHGSLHPAWKPES